MAEEVNVTDQDTMSPEELKQMAEMEAGDKGGQVDPPAPVTKPATKKTAAAKPAAEAPKPGEGEGAEGADAGDGKGGKGGPIKDPAALAALQEARAETKRLREQAIKDQERFQTLESRTNLILERLVPKKEEPKPKEIPSFETDPAGFLVATMEQTGKSLEEVKAELANYKQKEAETEKANGQRTAVQQLMNKAIAAENEFKAKTPDYIDASNFLLGSRKEELTDMGYDDAQANAIINNERLAIAQQALQGGKNPAEVVYNIAKRRGFAKAAPAEGEGDGDGKVVDAAAEAKKLANLKAGQEQGQSLSGARGQGPSPMTAARLLEMSEAEFAAAMETKEGRALMGQ